MPSPVVVFTTVWWTLVSHCVFNGGECGKLSVPEHLDVVHGTIREVPLPFDDDAVIHGTGADEKWQEEPMRKINFVEQWQIPPPPIYIPPKLIKPKKSKPESKSKPKPKPVLKPETKTKNNTVLQLPISIRSKTPVTTRPQQKQSYGHKPDLPKQKPQPKLTAFTPSPFIQTTTPFVDPRILRKVKNVQVFHLNYRPSNANLKLESNEPEKDPLEDHISISTSPRFVKSRINPGILQASVSVKLLRILLAPQAIVLDIVPQVLSPSVSANLLSMALAPLAGKFSLNPKVLSPSVSLGGAKISLSPKVLVANVSPNLLSPSLALHMIDVQASPKVLTASFNPCLLGPNLAFRFLTMRLNPSVLTSNISPSILCPAVKMQLMKVNLSPKHELTHNLSPSLLSPSVDMSLMTV